MDWLLGVGVGADIRKCLQELNEKMVWGNNIPKWGDMLGKGVAALKKDDCDLVTNYALKKCLQEEISCSTKAFTSLQISISAEITVALAFYPGFIQNQQNIKLSNAWGTKREYWTGMG